VSDLWHINGYRLEILIEAIRDIEKFHKKDPQISRLVTKKIIYIAKNPLAGKRLHGDLLNFRKITVGDNHWRIVWRVYESEKRIEYSVIWGVGARANEEIYKIIRKRIAELGDNPETVKLRDALELMNPKTIKERFKHSREDSIADLQGKLVEVAGIPSELVSKLDVELAKALWRTYLKQ
jgi:mRNA interferase RelE/StbE